MRTSRSMGIAGLAAAVGLALSGCGGSASGATPVQQPASLAAAHDGSPGTVALTQASEQRLDIRTAPVSTAAGGTLTVPYGAVVYEPDGSAWAYVETSSRHFQRQGITIRTITGDTVTLGSGPAAGTAVVVQGAAELVGVESGIDGEE